MQVLKKRIPKLIALTIIIALLLVCSVNNLHKEKYKWAITTYPKVNELCKSNTNGYVIFKKNTCEYCDRFLKKFKALAKEENINVLIVETSEMSKSEKKECKRVFNTQYVPSTFRIKKNEIQDQLIGDCSKDEIRKFIEKTK